MSWVRCSGKVILRVEARVKTAATARLRTSQSGAKELRTVSNDSGGSILRWKSLKTKEVRIR